MAEVSQDFQETYDKHHKGPIDLVNRGRGIMALDKEDHLAFLGAVDGRLSTIESQSHLQAEILGELRMIRTILADRLDFGDITREDIKR